MNTNSIISSSKVLLLLVGLVFSSSSFAAIVSGSVTTPASGSNFSLIAPPTTVGNNNFQVPHLFAFDEQQGVTLMNNLTVNVGGTAGIISAGTAISSHYVFFDPKKSLSQIGSVLFDADVLGIITMTADLMSSHFLGAASTNYLSPTLLGLESGDSALIDMMNPQQINLDWRASTPGDYIRVITAAPVPLPAAFWLFGSAILATVGWSRKKVAV